MTTVAAMTDSEDDVKILPPDRALQEKLGGVNLDQLFSPQVVVAAQQVIVQSSDRLLDESVSEMERLERAARALAAAPDKATQVLPEIIASSFSLKSKAGLSGYELVAAVAKSLHLRCEEYGAANLTAANLEMIRWHVESLKRLLPLKVKGLGGPIGEEILAELTKI
ncbi:MAG: hypothetical protein PHY92_02855 [Alphaproteobacteria bacterium]|nr:hypothetical protein [Alphaproteobacteria bacterium]